MTGTAPARRRSPAPGAGFSPSGAFDTGAERRMLLLLVLIALLPTIGYQFGWGNQIEQFPIIERLKDPTYLARDVYVDSAAAFGPRIYYARALSLLTDVLPLPAVIAVLSFASNLGLAWLAAAGARRFLGTDRAGGLLAALLAVTNGSFALGLAGYLQFDSFQPASVAIPFALFGLHLILSGRAVLAVLPFALAILAHPLIGAEVAMISVAAAALATVLRPDPKGRLLRDLLPLALCGGLVLAVVAVAWILPAAGLAGERLPPAEFFDTLARLRAPHHYIGSTFPTESWIIAAAFLLGFGLILARRYRDGELSGPAARAPVTLALAGLIAVLLSLASLWFVDVAESRAWVTAQVFRMLMLLKWAGFLFLAVEARRWIARDGTAGLLLAAGVVLATADSQPWVILIALALNALLPSLPRGLRPVVAAMAPLAAALLFRRYGAEKEVVQAAVGLACLGLAHAPWFGPRAGVALATVVAAGAVTLAVTTRGAEGPFGRKKLAAHFVWADQSGPQVELARWAAAETPSDSLWLVPPDFERFRFLARRAVVADFTSIPFDDAAMRDWRQRMEALYGPFEGEAYAAGGFSALAAMRKAWRGGETVSAAAAAYGADFAILHGETPWDGPVLLTSGPYKAVALTAR